MIDRMGRDELFYEIAHHEIEKVRGKLKGNIDLSVRDENKMTYLHVAVINYDYEITKLLVELGAEIDCIDNNENTPLMYAVGEAGEESHKIAKYLIDKGANLDLKAGKYSARELIVMFEDEELMEYIKEKGMSKSRASELPTFKYFPDPLKEGVIKEEKTLCPVCGKESDYVYVGLLYAIDSDKGICPWCIKDGKAAEKYDGEFQPGWSCEKVDSDEYMDELIHRTPGYFGCQEERWLSHCGDYCAFMGGIDRNKFDEMEDELREDIERIVKSEDITYEDFQDSIGRYRWAYLFKCLRCGMHRLTTDAE